LIGVNEMPTRLDGIDLSAAMVKRAGARGIYDSVVQGDLVDYMGSFRQAFLASQFYNFPCFPQTVPDLKGVIQLDKLDKDHALLLVQSESGAKDLKAIQLP